ncbi:hypothetical protein EMCRGX_G000480 [Ephydatia muelleri]
MHVKEDLVYDKHEVKLLAFINLGDTNNQLLQFETSMSGKEQQDHELAKTMLVLMVRGLFSNLSFPYAQFSSSDTTKGDLFMEIVWEAVMRLECLGLKVLYITADGATNNRRFFKLHDPSSPLVHKTENPFDPDRFVYFFSDPPHLIKTTRNCWSKNMLWCNGKNISWDHLSDLYVLDNDPTKTAPGLRLVPKLMYEHIHLTSFSRMRVDLAAEALSETVAKAIQATEGAEAEETVKFIEYFDKFFDCLNVDNYTSGRRQRKEFREPHHNMTVNWSGYKMISLRTLQHGRNQ